MSAKENRLAILEVYGIAVACFTTMEREQNG